MKMVRYSTVLALVIVNWALGRALDTKATAPAPKLVVQSGHNFSIQSILFSRDGHWFVTAGWDGNVKIWDFTAGLEVATLSPHSGGITALALSDDNRLLAAASKNILTIWDFETGQQKQVLQDREAIFDSLSFSHDDAWLVSGSKLESRITVWNLRSQRVGCSIKGDGFSISPDDRNIAIGSSQDVISLHNIETCDTSKAFKQTGAPVGFSRDGDQLAFSAADGVHIWSLKQDREVNSFGGATRTAVFDQQWTLMASASENTVTVWDLKSGRQLWKSEAYQGAVAGIPVHVVSALAFHPTQGILISGNWDNTISYWDVPTGHMTRLMKHHTERLGNLILSPDGHWLATISENQKVTLWDIEKDTGTRKVDSLGTVAFNPDGSSLAVLESRDTVVIKNVLSQQELLRLAAYGDVTSILFDPNWKSLFTVTTDYVLHVWNIDSGTQRQLHLSTPNRPWRIGKGLQILGVADKGKLLVLFDPAEACVTLWSLAKFQALSLSLAGLDSVGAALLSEDGQWLAVSDTNAESKHIRLYNIHTQSVREIAASGHPVAFTHDGRLLAIARSKNSLLIINTATLQTIKTLADVDEFSAAALTSKGSHLFLGTAEGTVIVYDLHTGKKRATLAADWDGLGWIAVAPNGLFDGSPTGMRDLLGWKFGPDLSDAAPIEIFLNEFYRPRLLSTVMKGEMASAPKPLSLIDRRQPSVSLRLAEASKESNLSASMFTTVKVVIQEAAADAQHSRGSGVRDVRLFRNGSLIHLWHGKVPLDEKGRAELIAPVFLASGLNTISCYAFNLENIKSADAILSIDGPHNNSRQGTAYIIAVGIDHYSNKNFNLRYANIDATFFATELRRAQEHIGRFAQVKVITLLDQEASRVNILNTLRNLRQENTSHATPDDTIFIYFAGHGLADASRYYLIPYDMHYSGPRGIFSAGDLHKVTENSISDLDLQNVLEGIDAGRIVLVIDACNSGRTLEPAESRLGPINTNTFAQLAWEKGMYVLAASQSYQAAIESSDFGHGLLTYALIHDGVQNGLADFAPKDGMIGIEEWFNYAVRRVPELDRLSAKDTRELFHPSPSPKIANRQNQSNGLQQPSVFYRRDALNSDINVAKVVVESVNDMAISDAHPAMVASPSSEKYAIDEKKPSAKQDTVGTILEKAADAYDHLVAYQIEAKTTMKSLCNGKPIPGFGDMNGVSIMAYSSPSKSRIESRSADGKMHIQVTDGFFTLQYDETSNSFRKRAVIPVSLPSLGLEGSDPNGVFALSGKALSQAAYGTLRNARLDREEPCPVGNRNIQCYVIEGEIDLGKGLFSGGSTKIIYWIDEVRYLPVRSEQKTVSSANGDTYESDVVIDSTFVRVNEAIPDNLFRFTPPEGAKSRGDFDLPKEFTRIGSIAPPFVLPLLDKKTVDSSRLNGKTVVLAFWTTWCEPCVAQLKVLQDMQKEFADKNMVLYGVNEEADGLAGQFLGRHDLSIESLSDPTASLRSAYSISGVPSIVIIDHTGRTAAKQIGLIEKEDLRKLLQKILTE